MDRIVGAVRAVYNFFVGDPILLTGTLVLFVVVGLITHFAKSVSTPLSVVLGIVLIAGVILSLSLSLMRETRPKKG
jgi:uncharacterized membrane protein